MSCVTAIGRGRRQGEPNRRAHDRHDDDVQPPRAVSSARDAQRITELTANDIIAVTGRSLKERFS